MYRPARPSSDGRSSRSAVLLPPSPLRTVHESFPSYGSSNSKSLPIQRPASQLTILVAECVVFQMCEIYVCPVFNTRHWCSLISSPGKTSAGDCGDCMTSSGIISARAAMAFSTAFSSVSLNVSMIILPTNLTSHYVACSSHAMR